MPTPPRPRARRTGSCLAVLLLCVAAPTQATEAQPAPIEASTDPDEGTSSTLFGGDVTRDGLHLQVAFGWAESVDAQGLFHAMELGYTLPNGWTTTYLYTLLQNEGFGEMRGGPERLEGHLLALKVPLYYPELVAKIAVGAEVVHDQASDTSTLGVAWLSGVDLHLPVHARSGFTLGLTAHHVALKGYQHWGVALTGGYTCF